MENHLLNCLISIPHNDQMNDMINHEYWLCNVGIVVETQ